MFYDRCAIKWSAGVFFIKSLVPSTLDHTDGCCFEFTEEQILRLEHMRSLVLLFIFLLHLYY